MKAIIALLFLICVFTVVIYLATQKKLSTWQSFFMLGFGIAAGFAIANYDVLKYLKFGRSGIEFETQEAVRKIDDTAQAAMVELNKEVENHKESIRLLISNANNTSEKLLNQESSLAKLIDTARVLQQTIEEQKQEVIKLNSDSQAAKREIEKINEDSNIVAFALIKAAYIIIVTKGEYGNTPRLIKASSEIQDCLNEVLNIIHPDPEERQNKIRQLLELLPPKE